LITKALVNDMVTSTISNITIVEGARDRIIAVLESCSATAFRLATEGKVAVISGSRATDVGVDTTGGTVARVIRASIQVVTVQGRVVTVSVAGVTLDSGTSVGLTHDREIDTACLTTRGGIAKIGSDTQIGRNTGAIAGVT